MQNGNYDRFHKIPLSDSRGSQSIPSRARKQAVYPDMKAVLFVNDSYFSYLLAEPVLRRFHETVGLVVLSTRNTGSASRLWSIQSRSSSQYFVYRSAVQCLSMLLSKLRHRSVASLARLYGIPTLASADFGKSLPEIAAGGPYDIGLAFNCDQKLGEPVFSLCRRGVLNVHASRLPHDAGISPILWAFARGDKVVWSTIYKMDSGIDTGPILQQIEIGVLEDDTAFSLYQRVCSQSGVFLADLLAPYVEGRLEVRPQGDCTNRTYWSWPDGRHQEMMRASRRKFLSTRDLVGAIFGSPTVQPSAGA